MVRVKINGVSIEMPYTPYPSQLVTISKLLSCFQTGTSALIESPTGTGKSLAMICGALGYSAHVRRDIAADDKERQPCRIFICSRTHSQLNQLVEQLKKTAYRPRITILGSKAQYCINPRLRDVADKNTACSDLIKVGGCVYFTGKERLIKRTADRIYDIEEMRAEGKKCIGCPYFASRAHVEDADVVFLPYNYLIDSKIRQASDISLANAIVIIDEAHNIEDVCRTAGSLELTSRIIELVLNELLGPIKKSTMLGEVKADFISLFEVFRKLKQYGEEAESAKENAGNSSAGPSAQPFFDGSSYDCKTRTRKGKGVLEELGRIGVKRDEFKKALETITEKEEAKDLICLTTLHLLEEIEKVFSMIEQGADSYVLCLQKFTEDGRYAINLWLLDPGVVFGPIVSSVRAIALLSGTLTPFASFASELRHAFPHQLVAPHILRDEQVFVASIRRGHLGKELCGTYAVAETREYLEQVAQIITDISRRVGAEGGTLVFVPSYAFLAKLSARVQGAIAEPRAGGGAEFDRAMKKFQARISQRTPCVMLCVYRGKAAEGINFQDSFARAVVAVGIPYPSIRDTQIVLKKEYNDRNGSYSGRQWYEAQAYRAMNQALGRAIRHANDWGAIFLLDSRLAESRAQAPLSSWVVKNIKRFDAYSSCSGELSAFVLHNSRRNAG